MLKQYEPEGRIWGFADLQAAARAVAKHLKAEGYFLAQAYLPAQTVESGVVEIAVLEGRIGRTIAKWEDDILVSLSRVNAMLDRLDGTLIHERTIEEALFLLGDLKGISVQSVLQPGENPGTADLVVNLSRTPRVDGTLGMDNLGSRFTGEYRVSGLVDWNSPLGRGDSFSVRGLSTIENDGLIFWRLSYLVPAGFDGTKVGAAYSQLHYELGTAEFEVLDARGAAEVVSVYLLHPFYRARNLNVFGTVGYDKRRLDDRLSALEFPSKRDLNVLTLAVVGDKQDFGIGGRLITWSAGLTTGRLEIRSFLRDQIDASETGRDAEGYYTKLNVSATSLQRISETFLVYVAFSGQLADRNLDSSEKMSLGGPTAVRAYPEGEAASDQAALATIELRAPLTRLRSWLEPIPIGSVFLDYGVGRINRFPLSTEENSRNLTAVGLGFTWGRQDKFVVRSTLAYGDPKGNQFYLQGSIVF